jgi:hypothetical protein
MSRSHIKIFLILSYLYTCILGANTSASLNNSLVSQALVENSLFDSYKDGRCKWVGHPEQPGIERCANASCSDYIVDGANKYGNSDFSLDFVEFLYHMANAPEVHNCEIDEEGCASSFPCGDETTWSPGDTAIMAHWPAMWLINNQLMNFHNVSSSYTSNERSR